MIINIKLILLGSPQSPTNLASSVVELNTLNLSWIAPPSLPTVSLNYMVAVTNINTSSNTSIGVRKYNTSNTSFNFTRSYVEEDGECDQYVWSVTAVNPAGISVPANYSTAVSFVLGTYYN